MTDPRLRHMMKMLETLKPLKMQSVEQLKLDQKTFKTVISENIVLITKAFRNQMVIPAFETFCDSIKEIYNIVSIWDTFVTATTITIYVIPEKSKKVNIFLHLVQEEQRGQDRRRHPPAGLSLP